MLDQNDLQAIAQLMEQQKKDILEVVDQRTNSLLEVMQQQADTLQVNLLYLINDPKNSLFCCLYRPALLKLTAEFSAANARPEWRTEMHL